jgi:regulator of sirC expression with transglutaminase-like and TPR domain
MDIKTNALPMDAENGWRYLKSARDEDIPLLWASLLIARDEYADLDMAAVSASVESWCEVLRGNLSELAHPVQAVHALNRFVFDEQGFAGNNDDYYDPRNSYLNEVISRRLGNPISLAIVQLELARRVGLPMQGVSFPGHFLLRFPVDDGLLILDPYHRGRSLDINELKTRASPHVPGRRVGDEQLGRMLEPAPNRVILMRMLRNLKQLYIEREDFERALRCADRLVYLDERDNDELRDRGKLYWRVGHISAARNDFSQYLSRAATASDADQVRQWLIELGGEKRRLN